MKAERIAVAAAALICGVTERELAKLAAEGLVAGAARFGRRWTFNRRRLEAWAARETAACTSVVYVVRSRDRVKIGTTRNLGQRLSQFRCANPGAVDLVAVFPGGAADEARLHQRFARHRVNGEWFTLSREIRQWLTEDGWL